MIESENTTSPVFSRYYPTVSIHNSHFHLYVLLHTTIPQKERNRNEALLLPVNGRPGFNLLGDLQGLPAERTRPAFNLLRDPEGLPAERTRPNSLSGINVQLLGVGHVPRE